MVLAQLQDAVERRGGGMAPPLLPAEGRGSAATAAAPLGSFPAAAAASAAAAAVAVAVPSAGDGAFLERYIAS